MLEQFLPELIAMFHKQITRKSTAPTHARFNMVKLDLDALRHEIRKFAGAGVLELPNFLGEQ